MGELIPFPNTGRAAPEPKTPLYPTMFCVGCGANRTVPPSAADPGPCPICGSTLRMSGMVGPVEGVSGHVGTVTYGDIFGRPA